MKDTVSKSKAESNFWRHLPCTCACVHTCVNMYTPKMGSTYVYFSFEYWHKHAINSNGNFKNKPIECFNKAFYIYIFNKAGGKDPKEMHGITDYNRKSFCVKSIDNVWFIVILTAQEIILWLINQKLVIPFHTKPNIAILLFEINEYSKCLFDNLDLITIP